MNSPFKNLPAKFYCQLLTKFESKKLIADNRLQVLTLSNGKVLKYINIIREY